MAKLSTQAIKQKGIRKRNMRQCCKLRSPSLSRHNSSCVGRPLSGPAGKNRLSNRARILSSDLFLSFATASSPFFLSSAASRSPLLLSSSVFAFASFSASSSHLIRSRATARSMAEVEIRSRAMAKSLAEVETISRASTRPLSSSGR